MDVLTPHQTLLLAFGEWGELAFAPLWLQVESIPVGVGLSSALLLSVGLFGSAILDRFFGGDETDDDDGDSLMGGDGLDDGDGFGDFDDAGGMDDWDDPFGDGADEEGESTDELDHRLTELEDEVARLSSTVNTVRSENTEISNTVDDIGENVRKLLDIYEMVTRGINPFVDDVQPGGGSFEDGSLGLFDDSGSEDEEEELDDSIASADAEGFFDEDLLEDGDDEDEFDEFDDALEDEFDDDDVEVTEEMETEITDDSGGKSFSELKDEYESGEAEWADDSFGFDGDPEAESEPPVDVADEDDLLDEFDDAEPVETDELLFEDDAEADVTATLDGELGDTLADADEGEDEPEADGKSEAEIETPTETETETEGDGDAGFEFGNTTDPEESDDAKPYLTTLPDAYVGDLLVIEWMEFLVENADVADAARAVRYYERIDWVAADVARTLEDFLVGFGRVNVAETDRPGTTELSHAHHVRSLEYVQALAGDSAGVGALRSGRFPAPSGVSAERGRRLRHDGGTDGF